jgi:hypothetical protein
MKPALVEWWRGMEEEKDPALGGGVGKDRVKHDPADMLTNVITFGIHLVARHIRR